MRRTQKNIFVYGEELTLEAASLEKLHQFEEWLSTELSHLEQRWFSRGTATAGRVIRQDPSPTSPA